MQHPRFPEMTFTALRSRADEVQVLDTVADCLPERVGDDREVTLFLTHDQSSHGYGDDHFYRLEGKEVIGVALCDLDGPLAAPEVLTRDDAVELFGIQWVEDRESME